jgi:hypothetical protein
MLLWAICRWRHYHHLRIESNRIESTCIPWRIKIWQFLALWLRMLPTIIECPEKISSLRKKSVCVWRVLSINVQEEKIKNVDDIYSMKKIFRKMVLKMWSLQKKIGTQTRLNPSALKIFATKNWNRFSATNLIWRKIFKYYTQKKLSCNFTRKKKKSNFKLFCQVAQLLWRKKRYQSKLLLEYYYYYHLNFIFFILVSNFKKKL